MRWRYKSSPACCRRPAGPAGFTLFEILVVMSILGLVYLLALPALSGAFAGPRLDRQARQLVATLRGARSVAILQGREVRFRVDRGAWRYRDRHGAVRQGMTLALQAPPGGSGEDGRPAIRFFPDGSATGGRLTLSGATGVRHINVHWLTGRVTQSRR